LSGATISVNVPDLELGGGQSRLALKVSPARARGTTASTNNSVIARCWLEQRREILPHTLVTPRTKGVFSYTVLFDPARYLDYRRAARFSSRVGSNL
jgi:hypothetical protein